MKHKAYEPLTHKVVDISELMKLLPKAAARELDNYFCEYVGDDMISVKQFEKHLNQEIMEFGCECGTVLDNPGQTREVLKWLKDNNIDYISLWIA